MTLPKNVADAFSEAFAWTGGEPTFRHLETIHAELHRLTDRLEAAERDVARLDFVERCIHALDWDGDGMKLVIVADDGSEYTADTYREAIDAAIQSHLQGAGDEA